MNLLSQISQITPESQITCIQNTGQAIAWVVITLGGAGGAVGIAIKGFFDVHNARVIAELEGEIKRLESENKHLIGDVQEEKNKNLELSEENNQLKSYGFTSQLLILENRLIAAEKRNVELSKKLTQAVNVIKNSKDNKRNE